MYFLVPVVLCEKKDFSYFTILSHDLSFTGFLNGGWICRIPIRSLSNGVLPDDYFKASNMLLSNMLNNIPLNASHSSCSLVLFSVICSTVSLRPIIEYVLTRRK